MDKPDKVINYKDFDNSKVPKKYFFEEYYCSKAAMFSTTIYTIKILRLLLHMKHSYPNRLDSLQHVSSIDSK